MSSDLAEFFLVSLPGLEELALAELKEWFPQIECRADYGGVTAWAPFSTGLSMNQVLKIPTRILVRLAHFRCRDFPKFFQKISGFDWSRWIHPDSSMSVFVSSKKSRLKIKSRIEETALEGWKDFQKKQNVKSADPDKEIKLYVRFLDDECTLSLDTSGERLHKRGLRDQIGEAPLRETIASALIHMLGRHSLSTNPVELIDPMVGSGTFLLEAGVRDKVIESRHFAFEAFITNPAPPPALTTKRPAFQKLIGFDSDAKTLAAATHNLQSLKSEFKIELREADFFHASHFERESSLQRWVICNPPYGERLRIEGPLTEYYVTLFAAVAEKVQPDLACFLLPAKSVKGKFLLPAGWRVLEKRPLLNGGIPIIAFIFGSAAPAQRRRDV